MGCVYLLHFARPYKHAQHYIGWAENLDKRIAHHRAGTGARLMQILKEQGIDFVVAKIWEDKDKNFERSLKNQNGAKRFCPCCKELLQLYKYESQFSKEWDLSYHA
jgi:predicted GIY-YIG superfamily endonuclease